MNRREFTASLAALAATPALPFGVSAATAPQSAFVPAGTYAWAQLIARAQNKCSPAMLARQLHLTPDVAHQLFNEMLRDGVLRAPGVAGVAQAAKPINATGVSNTPMRQTLTKLRRALLDETSQDAAHPLVKEDTTCLGCDNAQTEDDPDASPDQHVQEIPQER